MSWTPSAHHFTYIYIIHTYVCSGCKSELLSRALFEFSLCISIVGKSTFFAPLIFTSLVTMGVDVSVGVCVFVLHSVVDVFASGFIYDNRLGHWNQFTVTFFVLFWLQIYLLYLFIVTCVKICSNFTSAPFLSSSLFCALSHTQMKFLLRITTGMHTHRQTSTYIVDYWPRKQMIHFFSVANFLHSLHFASHTYTDV